MSHPRRRGFGADRITGLADRLPSRSPTANIWSPCIWWCGQSAGRCWCSGWSTARSYWGPSRLCTGGWGDPPPSPRPCSDWTSKQVPSIPRRCSRYLPLPSPRPAVVIDLHQRWESDPRSLGYPGSVPGPYFRYPVAGFILAGGGPPSPGGPLIFQSGPGQGWARSRGGWSAILPQPPRFTPRCVLTLLPHASGKIPSPTVTWRWRDPVLGESTMGARSADMNSGAWAPETPEWGCSCFAESAFRQSSKASRRRDRRRWAPESTGEGRPQSPRRYYRREAGACCRIWAADSPKGALCFTAKTRTGWCWLDA